MLVVVSYVTCSVNKEQLENVVMVFMHIFLSVTCTTALSSKVTTN